MKKLYVSSLIPKSTLSMLEGMGFSVLLLPACNSLPASTATHADMLLFCDNELIVGKQYYNENKELFDNPTLADECLGNKYPLDILFNCFVIDNTLFGKLDFLCKKIKDRYKDKVNLNQGYAKCSTTVLEKSVITADENISETLSKQGFEVLKISPGNIFLPGYDSGFIGGASLVFGNTLFFFGDITRHPDYKKIEDFCKKRNYIIKYDKNYPLTDFGGGIFA